MYIIDLDLSPKAAEFAKFKALYDKDQWDFKSLLQAALHKQLLWKHLGLKCSENDEYEIKNGVLIIRKYEKI